MRRPVANALRFRPSWPEDWLVWTLRIALVAAGVLALLAPPALRYTTPGPLLVTVAAGLAASLAVSAVETRRPRTVRLVELSLLVAVGVHVAGHLFGFYHAIPWYDTVLHAFAGLAAGMCAYGLSQATTWFWRWEEETPFRTFYLVLSFVALAVVATEMVEFLSDRFLGTLEQRDPVQDPLTDTMVDLVAGMLLGALAAGVAAAISWWGHREGFDGIAESPKAPSETGAPTR